MRNFFLRKSRSTNFGGNFARSAANSANIDGPYSCQQSFEDNLVYRFIYIFYTLLKRLLFCSILIVAISIEICILVIIAITMITSMQTFPIIIMQICAKKIIKSNRKTDQIDPCNCQTFVHGNYQCWSGGKTKY